MNTMLAGCAVLPMLLTATPALSGPAADVVAEIYANLGRESDLSMRALYADPALGVLNRNDEAWALGETGCIDFSFAVDAQDWDDEEIARSLMLTETPSEGGVLVTAEFSLFGEPRTLEWTLVEDAESWLVADVASPANGWRLGSFACEY
jgi:hypothetical protein